MKAHTFKDAATANLKVEALLMKAMHLLGVDSLESTQEDMQNRSNHILRLTVGPGECKAVLLDTSMAPEPEFKCLFCGAPSYVDPSDQSPPPAYCHESDHGSSDDIEEAFADCRQALLSKGCHRSHPHENMSPECEAKAEEVRISAVDQVRKAFGLDPTVHLDEVFDRR